MARQPIITRSLKSGVPAKLKNGDGRLYTVSVTGGGVKVEKETISGTIVEIGKSPVVDETVGLKELSRDQYLIFTADADDVELIISEDTLKTEPERA